MAKQVVYKETLDDIETTLVMPKGAELLHCAIQYDFVRLWFRADPDRESEYRYFRVFITGERSIPENAQYVGTIFKHNGDFVYHVFEVFNAA